MTYRDMFIAHQSHTIITQTSKLSAIHHSSFHKATANHNKFYCQSQTCVHAHRGLGCSQGLCLKICMKNILATAHILLAPKKLRMLCIFQLKCKYTGTKAQWKLLYFRNASENQPVSKFSINNWCTKPITSYRRKHRKPSMKLSQIQKLLHEKSISKLQKVLTDL